MVRHSPRLLSIAVTAITLLCLVTASEARDKKKCYIYSCPPAPVCQQPAPLCCQPAPLCCRPKHGCVYWPCRAPDYHCATAYLYSMEDDQHVLTYFYDSGTCLSDCATAGDMLALGLAPPAVLNCDADCDDQKIYCVYVPGGEVMISSAARKPHPHKNIPMVIPGLLADKNRFKVSRGGNNHGPAPAMGYAVQDVGERRVKFHLNKINAMGNSEDFLFVAVLKTIEVSKENAGVLSHHHDAFIGLELNPDRSSEGDMGRNNVSKATLIENPNFTVPTDHTIELEFEGHTYVVMTGTPLVVGQRKR